MVVMVAMRDFWWRWVAGGGRMEEVGGRRDHGRRNDKAKLMTDRSKRTANPEEAFLLGEGSRRRKRKDRVEIPSSTPTAPEDPTRRMTCGSTSGVENVASGKIRRRWTRTSEPTHIIVLDEDAVQVDGESRW
jgi:hypothetical protein